MRRPAATFAPLWLAFFASLAIPSQAAHAQNTTSPPNLTVGDAVTFNDATDVLRKAGVNGYRDAFKVTVCQPYISPDVPRKLGNCSDLCVVNAEDLAEAFVRIRTGQVTVAAFFDWLSRPGQALRRGR